MATKIVGSNFPDAVSEQLSPDLDNYGENGWSGASSLLPGQDVTRSLDISPRGGDGALDKIKSAGSRGANNPPNVSLSAEMSAGNVPNHRAMLDPNRNNPTVPGALVDGQGDHVRLPKYETSK